jgi:hypothetical protein
MNNNPNNPKDANSELYNMLKNPLEISIYNNFQRYNDKPNKNIINPIINPLINPSNNEIIINHEERIKNAKKFLKAFNFNSRQ